MKINHILSVKTKVFVICSVRGTSNKYRKKIEDYVAKLESKNYEVYLPHRDTDQNASGYNICKQNMNAIMNSHEVHIFYSSLSQDTHFDMGIAFAFGKKIVVVENEIYGEEKNFPRILDEWEMIGANKDELPISDNLKQMVYACPNDFDLGSKIREATQNEFLNSIGKNKVELNPLSDKELNHPHEMGTPFDEDLYSKKKY